MDDTGVELGRTLIPLFAPICHRNPSRSFPLSDGTVILCARCMGLYVGAFAGGVASAVWAWTKFRLSTRADASALLAGILITPIEVAGEVRGVWSGSPTLRAILGLITGAALACAIIRSMGEGAAAPPARGRGWLRVVPLLIGGALAPWLLSPHRWGTAGTMLAAALLPLGLLVFVGAPLVLAVIHVRRLFST